MVKIEENWEVTKEEHKIFKTILLESGRKYIVKNVNIDEQSHDGSSRMVYLLTKLGYTDGKCHHISHTYGSVKWEWEEDAAWW